MKKILIIFLILFLLNFNFQFISSLTATSSSYSVGKFGNGIASSKANSDNYNATTLSEAKSVGDAQSNLYQAVISFLGKAKDTTSVVYSVTINQTEIVQAGNVYSVTIEIINSSGNVDVTSSPKITIYDSLKNLVVSNVDMSLLSGKRYQYNFTTNLVDVAGIKETNISVGINGVTKKYNTTWTLSNGRTAISINSINTADVPTIRANVTITNEDAEEYEYPYEYCIVSTMTQQCGNSANVAHASGYKLLDAGESWNTILSLDISQSGNYWFKIVADYGTQSSGATRSFSATYTPSGSSGTGGSSGGGSSSSKINTIEVSESATVSEQQITKGIIAKVEENEKINFNFKQGSTTESHTITLSKVEKNIVTLIISSKPITIKLKTGEEKEVDINDDGIDDIYFKLNKIENSKADLLIKKLIGKSFITGNTINYPKHLMDVSVKIMEDYRVISPDSKILAEITLYNLGTEEIKDAHVEYCIGKESGEKIKCSSETIAVYTKIQLVKEFLIPSDMEEGGYYLKVTSNYGNETASSQTTFLVKKESGKIEEEIQFNRLLIIILIILVALITISIVLLIKRNSRRSRYNENPSEIALQLKHLNELKLRKVLSEENYLEERKNLLAKVGEMVIGNKKIFVYVLIALFGAITLVVNFKTNLTGMIVQEIFYFGKKGVIIICSVLILFLLIYFRKKITSRYKKIFESSKNLFKKKHPSNCLKGLLNKKVYSEDGNYVGEIEEIILERNKINSLRIKLNKKYKFKLKGIIIGYSKVRGVGEVVVIEENILRSLQKIV